MNIQDITINSFDTALLQKITNKQAWYYRTIPLKFDEQKVLHLLIDKQKNNVQIHTELEMLLGFTIQLESVHSDFIGDLLNQLYRKEKNNKEQIQQIDIRNIKTLLPNLINEAKSLGGSDIHLEPYENKCRVRIRVDGVLLERYILNKIDYPSLINKIKIQANLDISEKRLPQDGRIFFEEDKNHKIDIRVSTLPTLHGEKVVLRLLSNNTNDIDIERLGLVDNDLINYLDEIKKTNGIILISGPTGSGKTTTLYATLKKLNETTRNILTIEDPIEYTLEGINQVQLREDIGLDFASTLRTFLRQDPDVIMVGEIRDKETAIMAIRAALTGHLVFSTIHTNSAWGIISRLSDMDIPNYLLADTLNMAVAQRLVRCLCEHCKSSEIFNQNLYPRNFKPTLSVNRHFVPVGCEFCFFTGYRGRKAIYEVIPIDYEFGNKIKEGDNNINDLLAEKNYKRLSENALVLLKDGITSIDEIYPILATQKSI